MRTYKHYNAGWSTGGHSAVTLLTRLLTRLPRFLHETGENSAPKPLGFCTKPTKLGAEAAWFYSKPTKEAVTMGQGPS